MSAIWPRLPPFASTAARDAHVYNARDVNQWVMVLGTPPTTYQVTSVSAAGVATFSQLGGGAVSSVFGRVGAVIAVLGDYAASLVTNDSTVAGATVKDALNTLLASGGAVSSVFGRVGAVVAVAGDYTVAQVTDAVAKTRQVIAGTGLTGGGDLSADRTFAADFGTAAGKIAEGNDTRIVNAVQTSRQIIAGTGLTGGGDLSADRTLSAVHAASDYNEFQIGVPLDITDAQSLVAGRNVVVGAPITIEAGGSLTIPDGSNLSMINGPTDVITGWVPAEDEIFAWPELQAWFDADVTTLTSGKVSSWTDRSGKGYHAVQATAAKQPTPNIVGMGGHGSLVFSGGQCLQITGFQLRSFSIVTVVRNMPNAAQIVYEHSADLNSNNGCFLVSEAASATIGAKRGGTRTDKVVAAWIAGLEPFMVGHHYDGNHATHYCYLNGNSVTGNANGGFTANPGAGLVQDTLNIGSRNNAASAALSGEICALAIFTPALTPGKFAAVQRHLARKYDVYYG